MSVQLPRDPSDSPEISRRDALKAVAKYATIAGGASTIVLSTTQAAVAQNNTRACQNPNSNAPECRNRNNRFNR